MANGEPYHNARHPKLILPLCPARTRHSFIVFITNNPTHYWLVHITHHELIDTVEQSFVYRFEWQGASMSYLESRGSILLWRDSNRMQLLDTLVEVNHPDDDSCVLWNRIALPRLRYDAWSEQTNQSIKHREHTIVWGILYETTTRDWFIQFQLDVTAQQDPTLNAMLVNHYLKTLERSATSITGFHFLNKVSTLARNLPG